MTVPDYISPVVGCRVWQWDVKGLKSLNGVLWQPGRAFTAECRTPGCHEAPQSGCTCGVYASKNFDHLSRLGYIENRIHGEVSLWGTVIEHEEGWRAQFSYPRNFVAPLSMVPLGMNRLELWLAALTAYGCDISVIGDTGAVPLWRTDSGVEAKGIELLMRRGNRWYARRAEQRRIKPGDRVAVLGHGIAIVEHADQDLVQAILGSRDKARIKRKEVVWCEQYMRWETALGASILLTACRT